MLKIFTMKNSKQFVVNQYRFLWMITQNFLFVSIDSLFIMILAKEKSNKKRNGNKNILKN